jgi:hypothetical protein
VFLKGKTKKKNLQGGNLKRIFCRGKTKPAYFAGVKTYLSFIKSVFNRTINKCEESIFRYSTAKVPFENG